MTNSEYLKSILLEDNFHYENRYIILALINSLSPEESLAFFDFTFSNDSKIREWTAKKIAKDIGIQKERFHDKFIQKLMNMLEMKKFKNRNTCGYALEIVIEHLPRTNKRKIVSRLLKSNYVQTRKRAYKIIQSDYDNYYERKLKDTFKFFQDEYLIWALLKNCSNEFVHENFDSFFDNCDDLQLVKLFLKATKIEPELKELLQEIDEISYSYVCAKNNLPLSDLEAQELISRNKGDERFGLLIWSIGQLGKWEVLKNFYENSKGDK